MNGYSNSTTEESRTSALWPIFIITGIKFVYPHNTGIPIQLVKDLNSPQISENWPRTIRVTVPQLHSFDIDACTTSLVWSSTFSFLHFQKKYMTCQFKDRKLTFELTAYTIKATREDNHRSDLISYSYFVLQLGRHLLSVCRAICWCCELYALVLSNDRLQNYGSYIERTTTVCFYNYQFVMPLTGYQCVKNVFNLIQYNTIQYNTIYFIPIKVPQEAITYIHS